MMLPHGVRVYQAEIDELKKERDSLKQKLKEKEMYNRVYSKTSGSGQMRKYDADYPFGVIDFSDRVGSAAAEEVLRIFKENKGVLVSEDSYDTTWSELIEEQEKRKQLETALDELQKDFEDVKNDMRLMGELSLLLADYMEHSNEYFIHFAVSTSMLDFKQTPEGVLRIPNDTFDLEVYSDSYEKTQAALSAIEEITRKISDFHTRKAVAFLKTQEGGE